VAVYRRDEYAEKHTLGPGCGFLLCWVAATMIGQVIGAALALPIFEWKPEGILSLLDVEATGGLCIGVFVGIAQALVLLPYLKLAGGLEWVVATALGRVVRVLLISMLSSGLLLSVPGTINATASIAFCLYLSALVFIGACAGAAIGYAQRFVLRRKVAYPHWWVWINVVVSVYISVGIDLHLFENFADLWAEGLRYWSWISWESQHLQFTRDLLYKVLSSGIPALLTGYVLKNLLHQPASGAKWSLRRRNERRQLRVESDIQISPEAMLEQQRNNQRS